MTQFYPEHMLPSITYHSLYEDNFSSLTHFEFDVMQDLSRMVEGIKIILRREKMVQISELYVAHLCGYLGFYAGAALGIQKATTFQQNIADLLETQAHASYQMFAEFPLYASLEKEIIDKHLNHLKTHTPGHLVVQTLRLGRTIWDSMTTLGNNRDHHLGRSKEKQIELFCPVSDFLELANTEASYSRRESRFPFLFIINQMTMQISWIMGYFGHLDKQPPQMYLDYGKPLVEMFIKGGDQYSLRAKKSK
jgi:hypothetical protein